VCGCCYCSSVCDLYVYGLWSLKCLRHAVWLFVVGVYRVLSAQLTDFLSSELSCLLLKFNMLRAHITHCACF